MSCEDGIKGGVLGDTSEGDVWHPFVDKTASNPFRFIFKFVVVEWCLSRGVAALGATCDAAGINRYPASAPILSDIGGGAASTGGIKDEISGICGHEETAFNNCIICLDNIGWILSSDYILPKMVKG